MIIYIYYIHIWRFPEMVLPPVLIHFFFGIFHGRPTIQLGRSHSAGKDEPEEYTSKD
jgi:hypothetical protein